MDKLDKKWEEATTIEYQYSIMARCHGFSEAVMAGDWRMVETYVRAVLSGHDERNPNPPGDVWIAEGSSA